MAGDANNARQLVHACVAPGELRSNVRRHKQELDSTKRAKIYLFVFYIFYISQNDLA